MSNCRSCGAAIRWVEMEKSGKKMPLDAVPVEDGLIWIFGGKGHTGDVAPAMGSMDRYTSHFATCPNAKRHRKT